jgi:hypothetical protein
MARRSFSLEDDGMRSSTYEPGGLAQSFISNAASREDRLSYSRFACE